MGAYSFVIIILSLSKSLAEAFAIVLALLNPATADPIRRCLCSPLNTAYYSKAGQHHADKLETFQSGVKSADTTFNNSLLDIQLLPPGKAPHWRCTRHCQYRIF